MTTQPEKTLRDEFAMAAMQASMSTSGAPWMCRDQKLCDCVAELAYQMADSMLAARTQEAA